MISAEKYLPLVEAVDEATGRRPHLSTVSRWCTKGRFGIRLESHVLGGRRLTTVESVNRFIEAVTAVSVGGLSPAVETPVQSSKRADRAAKELESRLS